MRRTLAIAALALTISLAFATASHAAPIYTAVDDQAACDDGQNINAEIQAHGGNVMRFGISPAYAGRGLDCVQAAYDAGYRVYLTVGYDSAWSPQQVATYFANVLPTYAPYLWAVSVGNEQDLQPGGSGGHGQICSPTTTPDRVLARAASVSHRRERRLVRVHIRLRRHRWVWRRRWVTRNVAVAHRATFRTVEVSRDSCRLTNAGDDYLAVWNAVEPILVQDAPQAIRVYGDVSPWGIHTVQQGFAAGAPVGVGAVAMHCYNTTVEGLSIVSGAAAWVGGEHLPLWCSEMAPSLEDSQPWIRRDSQASWDAAVSATEQAAPNLQMVSYYNWPGF